MMPYKNNNTVVGLQRNNVFQVGVSNIDQQQNIERDVRLPVVIREDASWMYFECTISAMLDSGIVVHNALPQVNGQYDTLAAGLLDNPVYDKTLGGVNLKSQDQYADIVQRMGHSRYWFRLWGRALRVGHQVPIPGIKMIGGVPAIPYDKNPQWAYNTIVPGGNYSGVILWRAEWSLWYTTAVPPTTHTIPSADPSAHISSVAPGSTSIQAPFSQADDNAVASAPGLGIAGGLGK